jgi:type IV pilus assembly protein PilW
MRKTYLPSLINSARMQGLSLIELMIAMTLGLVVVSAVGWVYLGTSQTYRSQDALARLQEGARYAFEIIGNDLRMTGATSCSYSTNANVINSTEWYKNLFLQPLVSLEKDEASDKVTEFSDALTVLHADVSREYIVQNHNAATAEFVLTASHDLSQGDLLIATDCNHAAVFQASAAGSPNVSHATTGTPGNSSANLGAGGVVYTFAPGSRLYRLSAVQYHIDTNPAGQPSLYRLRPIGTDAKPTAEELVEGVEDLQVAYGVDLSTPADGLPDFNNSDGDDDPYLRSDQITDAGSIVPGATAQERWQRVVSVRISLLTRTVEDNVAPTAQHYKYNNTNVTAADRRLHKVFSHVIKMRNR